MAILLPSTFPQQAQGFAIVATGLKQCLTEGGDAESLDTKKMEKLFLSVA